MIMYFSIFLFFSLEWFNYTLKGKNASDIQGQQTVGIVIHIVASLLGLALCLWLYSIVYRAYKCVKEFEGNNIPTKDVPAWRATF